MINNLFSRIPKKDTVLEGVRTSQTLLEHLLDPEKARKLAEVMARTHSPQLSHRVLILAHKHGCQFKQNAYECVAYQLAIAKHWRLVLSMVLLGKQHTGRTTVRLLNWRTRALVEMQLYASLHGILDEFEHAHLKPTRRTFHLLISGHIRNRNLAKAKESLQKMKEAGLPADASTHALIAIFYRSLGGDPKIQARALETLPSLPGGTTTAVLNSLLQLRLDAHDLPGAFHILAFFDQSQVDQLTSLSGEDSTLDGGERLLFPTNYSPFCSHKPPISPNATTFSILLNYMATRRDIPGALRILKRMVAVGVIPTAATVTSLMHVYFATGDRGTAVRLVAEMCDRHTTPLQMFSPIMPMLTGGELPLATSGIPPTVQVFNALLRGVLGTYGLNSSYVVLRIMRANNIQPNAVTLEILIAHLNKVEHARPGMLLRVLRNLSSATLRPTLRHMHVILSSILRHEKYVLYGRGWNATAARFSPHRHDYSRFIENRISSVADSFDPAAGIEFPQQLSYCSLARPIVQSLSSRQIRSDGATFALRIRRDAVMKSDLEAAREVFHTLLARGMHPNKYHFSALMEGFAQSGDLKAAAGVMKSAMRVDIKPNVVMFTILIVGHARQGNPDLAIRVFQHMLAMGIEPDVPAIDAVSSAFFAVGAYAMSRRILITLWPHIQPFPAELRRASLKDLADKFRLLGNNHGVQEILTKQQRLMLHWKLKGLLEAWKLRKGRKRFGRNPVSNVSRTSIKLQKPQLLV